MSRRLCVLAATAAIMAGACGSTSSASNPTGGASTVPSAQSTATAAPSVADATLRPTPKPLPTALARPADLTLDGMCEPDHTCLVLLEHVDALVAGGATFYASGLSSRARALTVESLGGLPVTMATPDMLVEITMAADRVLTY
jgi:hypothetical protein